MRNLNDDVIAASPEPAQLSKNARCGDCGVSGLSAARIAPAQGQTATEGEVLKFALNLEYLESEFHTFLVMAEAGKHLASRLTARRTPLVLQSAARRRRAKDWFQSCFPVSDFSDASEIANDERQRVVLLCSALGSQAIAKPNLDLNGLASGSALSMNSSNLSAYLRILASAAYAGGAG